MDKARDVRCGATRFKHSRHKLSSEGLNGVGENFEFSEKSRREKLRKLSAVVGRSSSSFEDGEMVSDREEDELPSSFGTSTKRFKLSQKFLDDGNGVGHASVPRRLRSAMKKRGRDSLSPHLPDSKKPNSSKFDVTRKSKASKKQGGSDKCLKPTVSMPITKEEEEVADALYALAGMFFHNKANDKSKENQESSEANPSDLPQSKGSHKPTIEVAEENVASSSVERLAETIKVESWAELNKIVEPNLPHSKKLNLPPFDSAPQVNLYTSSSLSAKTEETCDVKPTRSSVKFCIPSDAGLNEARQKEASILERKPGTALGMATPVVSQMEPPHTVDESKNTGLVLWPGLPSTVSKGARVDDLSLPSSAAKLPSWLDVAFSAARSSSLQNDSFGKASKVTTDRRLSKRCATHVYISRLIQALRMSENKELPMSQGQVRPHERLKQGFLPTINNFIEVANGVNGLVSDSSIDSAVSKQNPNGAKTGVLQPKLHQLHPFSAVSSAAVSTWQKQNFDFYLSLVRGGGVEASDSFSRARNGMEPLSPLQNPYLPSLVQHQFSMPFSLPQSYCNSSACSDHLSSSARQVHMQLSSYSSPFCGVQAVPTALTKHQQQQPQQPQQRLWGAHYRPEDAPKTTIQFLSLQNGPTSQRQQQQQQQHSTSLAPSPLNPGKVTRHDHHLPSVYEEPGGGFRTSALPLQLLCSEHL